MITLDINGRKIDVDAVALVVTREQVALTGANTGMVQIRWQRRSLLFGPGRQQRKITTIEGLSRDRLHPLQKPWVTEQGRNAVIDHLAAALLQEKPKPTEADIDAAVTNICRCGTLRRLNWDGASSWRPPVLRMLRSVVGLVLFGSDQPYPRGVGRRRKPTVLADDALRPFPRLAVGRAEGGENARAQRT